MKTKLFLSCLGLLTTLYYAQVPQTYKDFNGTTHNLYAWSGSKVMLLSSSNTLDTSTMQRWVTAMDGTYNYYQLCTNREPTFYTNVTYINNRSTIAQVPSTCGTGCGYIGWTGIELQTAYFDNFYNTLLSNNQYSQEPFYEFGRNFWFYSDQLQYKSNDPIVTGYACFMRFMSMENQNLQGAPFYNSQNGLLTWTQVVSQIKGLVDTYMANQNLNWSNTLGVGSGVPNSGWGGTDLFTSFCFKLRDMYGENWVRKVWRFAGQRPAAATTQDAVDNFIIASSQAANTNLTAQFVSWKWPVSTNLNTIIDNILSTKEHSLQQLKIYPNPVKDILNLSEEVSDVRILDVSGKTIKTILNSRKSVDVSGLSKGVYVISASTKTGEKINKKFVKE